MKSLLMIVPLGLGWLAMGFQSLPFTGQGTPGSADKGKALYLKYCSTCHGVDGTGTGTAAVYLFPKPRDFTKGLFKFQSTPSGSLPTDADLERTIRNGMPGSAMPAWDGLSEGEQRDLVAFIKTFSERFSTEKPQEALVIEKEPSVTPDMLRKGKAIFALSGCWMCHGLTGAGDGPSAEYLRDDLGQLIPPYNFTGAGAFKGGGTPGDIYRTFSTGVGGTPMPGYGEDVLAVARESFGDLTNLEGYYSSEEIREIKEIVAQWPAEKHFESMSSAQRKQLADERRWSLVYYVLSLSKSAKSQVSYTTRDHELVSSLVKDVTQFTDPFAAGWKGIKSDEFALISLWQRDTQTDRIDAKSVTDGRLIAFRLEWDDVTKDDQALHGATFGDAVAIQFPLDPLGEPFFGMGDTNFAVNIWQWKSWWEVDREKFAGVSSAFPDNATDFYFFDVSGGSRMEYFVSKDSAREMSMPWNSGWAADNPLSAQERLSSIEDLNAKGFGTLRSQEASGQNVSGNGVWKDGRWSVVLVRTLASKEQSDVLFKAGTNIPFALAVWDGSSGDRDGQKMVTNWYRLIIAPK